MHHLIRDVNGIVFYGDYPYTEINFCSFKYQDKSICGFTKDGKYMITEPIADIHFIDAYIEQKEINTYCEFIEIKK